MMENQKFKGNLNIWSFPTNKKIGTQIQEFTLNFEDS